MFTHCQLRGLLTSKTRLTTNKMIFWFQFQFKKGENRCEDSFSIILYIFNIIILQMDTQDDLTRMWDQPECETVCLLFVVTISQLLWWGDTFRSALIGCCWHFVRGSHILDKLAGANGMLKFDNKGKVAFRHFILKVYVRVLLTKLLVSQWDFIQFNSIYASTLLRVKSMNRMLISNLQLLNWKWII